MKLFTRSLLFALAFLALTGQWLSAQDRERMVVYQKNGTAVGYWVDRVDSVKFLTQTPDLAVSCDFEPIAGTTGGMKIKNITAGKDVTAIHLIVPKATVVPADASQEDLETIYERHPLDKIYLIEAGQEYDFSGLQNGDSYAALLWGVDSYGCKGPIKRIDFTVPKGPLAGNPAVEVVFSDITSTGYTVSLTPNADCFKYYFLNDPTDNPEREGMMKMLGIATLRDYVVAFGGDRARGGHVSVKTSTMKGFLPDTEYTVFLVMEDANGQLSDVITSHTVRTKGLGTSETSHVKVTVTDITATSATVWCEPDINTAKYRYLVQEKSAFNEEEVTRMFKEEPDNLGFPYTVGNDNWTWHSLKPNKTYYAIAMGQNADGVWGAMEKVEFTTPAQ